MAEHRLSPNGFTKQKDTPDASIHLEEALFPWHFWPWSTSCSLFPWEPLSWVVNLLAGIWHALPCLFLSEVDQAVGSPWLTELLRRPYPGAGSGLAWDWKVKSAPCRDVAVSWKSHTNMDSNLAFTSIMKVILYFGLPSIDSLGLFLSLFRIQASKRCYLLCPLKVIYHSYLMLWPRKDFEEDTIFVHLTDEKLRIRRIKGPKVNHFSLVYWVLSPLALWWECDSAEGTELRSDDGNN